MKTPPLPEWAHAATPNFQHPSCRFLGRTAYPRSAQWAHDEGAIMKRIGLPGTVNALYLRQTSRCTIERVYSVMRATARAVAADNALALRAATKAEASPRRSLAEVRAMYVPSSTTID